jgi:hypothetical protein
VFHSDLLEEWLSVWHRSGGALPPLDNYSANEQSQRERQVDQALDSVQTHLVDGGNNFGVIVATAAHLACSALAIDNTRTEALLRDDFFSIARDLASRARHLDPTVSTADILQACRNAWTACGLQAVLAHPPRLTPSIFAYSMLYPYSDNYLDDKNVSRAAKLDFSARFRLRLHRELAPADALEKTIWQLVSLIEEQWPRRTHSDLYDALLAIHHAQEQSLKQQTGRSETLRLSFAKGGASVLADAYLAKGSLSEAERRFAFGWGVLLQLADDLQDLASDRQRGFHTLFSVAAAKGPLDDLTTRTLHFASAVMESMQALPGAPEHLKELLQKNSISLLITAAARYSDCYSAPYLRRLERSAPLRFGFLKSRKQRVTCWLGPDTEQLFENYFCYSLSRRSNG